jgi:hypothetical protein
VVTNVPSVVVVEPTPHGGDAVAGWLLGPTGLLQVVVMNVTGSVDELTAHDATAPAVLLPAGRVQM